MANTDESRCFDMAPVIRFATPCASWPGPVRSFQSFSGMKASATFWPWPEKLKPTTPTMLATSGCFMMNASASASTSLVRASVAPAGSWMLAMM